MPREKERERGQKKNHFFIFRDRPTSSTSRCFSEHAICVTTSSGDRHPEAISAPTREAPGVARRTLAAGVARPGAELPPLVSSEEPSEEGLTWPK